MMTPEMMEAVVITESNEDSSICTKCGGLCCRLMGCEIFPQDVKRWFQTDTITKEHICKLLATRLVQLDWYEEDVRFMRFGYSSEYFDDHEYHERCYYLHMRNGNDPAVFGSFGGRCRALTDTGCSLPWELRPTGGQSLVPTAGFNCIPSYGKPECALAWIPYYDIMDECTNINCYDDTEYRVNNLMSREEWHQLIQGGKQ